ncbi:MAG: tRNA lysidine(34) synthetase TilS [Acidobacteriota bacterium]
MTCYSKDMLLLKVIEAIQKYSLFKRGDAVVVACSGGADSVSLFHVLNRIKNEWKLDLLVGHYNHKLRREADEDQSFVARLASDFSLPFYSESGDVKTFAQKSKLNLEEAGRKLRYGFLKKIARKHGSAKIATGHTMTDQAETVLMRILRGTGSHGFGGMGPKTKEGIVRPLILVKREEVKKYIEEENLLYRIDESNFNVDFLRNRIRHRLIPYLKNNYSPHVVDHLSRLASIVQEEDLFLKDISKKKEALAEVKTGGQNQLDMDFLHTLPQALQRRVVREYLSKKRGDLREVSYKDIQSIIDLGRGKEFHLEKDLILTNQNGLIGIKKQVQKMEYEYTWTGKNPLVIKETGITIKGSRLDKESFSRDFDNRKKVFFDSSKLKFPLKVRNRHHGDRYRPFGAPGKQKIKELMRAKRIPESSRDKKPVFLSEDEIIWVQGLPVSEEHKVESSTKNIFKIEIFPQK